MYQGMRALGKNFSFNIIRREKVVQFFEVLQFPVLSFLEYIYGCLKLWLLPLFLKISIKDKMFYKLPMEI